MSATLKVRGLRKQFGGLTAVKDVSFVLASGTVTGILGPNGAGKTTLFNLITGFIPPDAGDIVFDGARIFGRAPHHVVNAGIARTFQIARPFQQMTTLENVAVACLAPRVRHEHNGDYLARARLLLGQVGLGAKADWPIEALTYGDLRHIEIARALATNPRLLLLDEPFAGLGASEIQPLANLIRKLRAHGIGILIIEHKLREMMRLVDRVIAMDFGEIIAEGSPAEIGRHPRVIESYLGYEEPAHGAA
ncbi:MAG: ABC transporter ATP-binding protein [Sulfurifustaceae bacterium]